ncbi:acyltransferase family protein [Acidicapsa acidisoli]|uniref:acyltransferase family protein n=1 Tax=Acidicapsa acidisoli TaxID=1615681 RepID=UPI0021E05062|nr:acyltransferase [Acidicapsa acidisoli]
MNVPVVVDRTSSGKEHFEVLDGLRGSAAFLIVIFHVFNYSFGFHGPWALVKHAYLAVDFFFALSGFVVAYAYDDRWTRMSILQFFRIRLIRLHPLVLIGATLGLLGYLFDPFSKASNHTDAPMLLLAYITSLLLLPSPPVGGRHNETQALNGPAWSLMQEYLANIAYALILRRLRPLTLAIIFGISGFLLIWTVNAQGSLDGGWDYPRIWMAPLRLTVSFVMGLWLYRVHDRIRVPKIGLLLLSIVLVVCFQMPVFPKVGEYSLNGFYDAACVLLLFPVIILCGAHSNAGTGMIRLCKFSGHLSYPLYITHIPFVYVLAGYSWTRHPSLDVKLTWIFLTIPFAIIVGWLILKYFDEPVRAWLTQRYGIKRTTV